MISSPDLETQREDSLSPTEEYIKVSDLDGYIVLTEDELKEILTETAEKASQGSVEIAYQEDLRPQIVDLKFQINQLTRSQGTWKTIAIVASSLLAASIGTIFLVAR